MAKDPCVVMLLSNAYRPDPRVLKEAAGLQSAGYQVTIICWDRLAELSAQEMHTSGFNVIRIQHVRSSYGIGKKQILKLPRFWRAVWAYLNLLKPAILHCHDFDTLPVGLAWGRLHRIPVIYDAHEHYAELCRPRLPGLSGKAIYYLIRFSELLGARLASAVITVDEFLANVYRKQNARILIIGHYPVKDYTSTTASVFSHNGVRMVYIGRLSRDRGMLIYVDILRCLLMAGIDARLILSGVFTPVSEEHVIKARIQGIEDQVEITGWIPYGSMPGLLAHCDLGFSILSPEPRYVNALPVKLFEYMAAGLPVIASRFPAISQIISRHDCGALVDPGASPQSIAEHIIHWKANPEIPMKLGANGRQAILQDYNWESLMIEVLALYASLLVS